MEKMPVEDLEDRRLYRIRSRNLVVGIWVVEKWGFIGVREKFGHEYPFMEYHYDVSGNYGTVDQMEPLDEFLPDDIPLWEGRSECEVCNEPARWVKVKAIYGSSGEWHHVDLELDNHEPDPEYRYNDRLFQWLKPFHDKELVDYREEWF